jgi:hypothetical protein
VTTIFQATDSTQALDDNLGLGMAMLRGIALDEKAQIVAERNRPINPLGELAVSKWINRI